MASSITCAAYAAIITMIHGRGRVHGHPTIQVAAMIPVAETSQAAAMIPVAETNPAVATIPVEGTNPAVATSQAAETNRVVAMSRVTAEMTAAIRLVTRTETPSNQSQLESQGRVPLHSTLSAR